MTQDPLAPPESIEATTAEYLAARRALSERALGGEDALSVAGELAARTDQWLVALWAEAAGEALVEHTRLLALGGYGRRELAFGSDIDLMIELDDERLLTEPAGAGGATLADAAERFIAWCRAARLKLGHAVRTAAQTRQELDQDIRSAIALLDARWIGGEDRIGWPTDWPAEAIDHLRADDQGAGFVDGLIAGYQARLARNGPTVYLLEPDIKCGEGGLRDLNCIHWAAVVRFACRPGRDVCPEQGWEETHRQAYLAGLGWILGLRHRLHLIHGRQHDRLTFPDQETIAQMLTADLEAAVPTQAERLMRRHYREARSISMLAQRFLRRWRRPQSCQDVPLEGVFRLVGGELSLTEDGPEVLEASQVLRALELASDQGALLDATLEMKIADAVADWGDDERADRQLNVAFRRLLTDVDTSPKTSERLLENGILTRLVPEFEPIVCHVQHDVYHVYTTDIHSLKCLEKARQMLGPAPEDQPAADARREGVFRKIAHEIAGREVWLLAALFHDIGKNRGGGHSRKGAAMMPAIGARLGLSAQQIDQLAFLVREHLTLSHTARRRDLSDRRVVRDIAARVRTVETLNQLAALTYCDMATVGPTVMTDWNAALLSELYRRLRQAIEHGVEAVWRDSQAEISAKRDAVMAALADDADAETAVGERRSRLDEFMRDLPTDHFVSRSVDELVRQFAVYWQARDTGEAAVRFEPLDALGVTEIIVATQDVPGTLAKIAGVISAAGLNIVSAEIVTTASGMTHDIFGVTKAPPATSVAADARPEAPRGARRLGRLERRLKDVLCGQTSVEEILRQRIAETRLAPRPTPTITTTVEAQPEASESFTVLEINAPDRIGLLYEMATTLTRLGVSTHLSKIDSLGTQVVDTFYVEELGGGKLSAERRAEVIDALRETIVSSPYLSHPDSTGG